MDQVSRFLCTRLVATFRLLSLRRIWLGLELGLEYGQWVRKAWTAAVLRWGTCSNLMCVAWRRDPLRPLHQYSILVRVDKVAGRFTFIDTHRKCSWGRGSPERTWRRPTPTGARTWLTTTCPTWIPSTWFPQVPGLATPSCPFARPIISLATPPLLTIPLASAWGHLLEGDKGAFHPNPSGSPNGQPLVLLGQVWLFTWPRLTSWGQPCAWCDIFAPSVFSRLFSLFYLLRSLCCNSDYATALQHITLSLSLQGWIQLSVKGGGKWKS